MVKLVNRKIFCKGHNLTQPEHVSKEFEYGSW